MKTFVLGVIVGLSFLAVSGKAHNRPGTEHNRRHAITYAFCGSLRPCPLGDKALSVAYCESGPNLWPYARNGQYLGMFQMGSYARARYGHGPDAWTQARAAYRYFIDSGRDWSPWECKP